MSTSGKQPTNLEICAARYIQLALRHEKLKKYSLTEEERSVIYGEMSEFLTLKKEEWDAIGRDLGTLPGIQGKEPLDNVPPKSELILP